MATDPTKNVTIASIVESSTSTSSSSSALNERVKGLWSRDVWIFVGHLCLLIMCDGGSEVPVIEVLSFAHERIKEIEMMKKALKTYSGVR